MIEQKYLEATELGIAREEKAARDRLIRERAIRLMGQARSVAEGATNFPHTPDGLKAEFARLVDGKAELTGPASFYRVPAAAEDDELRTIDMRIRELRIRDQQHGWLPKEAA